MNSKFRTLLVGVFISLISYSLQHNIILRVGEVEVPLRELLFIIAVAIIAYTATRAYFNGSVELLGSGTLGRELYEIYKDSGIMNQIFATQQIQSDIHYPIGTEIRPNAPEFTLHEKLTVYRSRRLLRIVLVVFIILTITALVAIQMGLEGIR